VPGAEGCAFGFHRLRSHQLIPINSCDIPRPAHRASAARVSRKRPTSCSSRACQNLLLTIEPSGSRSLWRLRFKGSEPSGGDAHPLLRAGARSGGRLLPRPPPGRARPATPARRDSEIEPGRDVWWNGNMSFRSAQRRRLRMFPDQYSRLCVIRCSVYQTALRWISIAWKAGCATWEDRVLFGPCRRMGIGRRHLEFPMVRPVTLVTWTAPQGCDCARRGRPSCHSIGQTSTSAPRQAQLAPLVKVLGSYSGEQVGTWRG